MADKRKETQYIGACFPRLFSSIEPPSEDLRLFGDFSLNSTKFEAQRQFLGRNS